MFHYETLVQWLEGIRRRLGEAMPHRPVVQKVYVDRSPGGNGTYSGRRESAARALLQEASLRGNVVCSHPNTTLQQSSSGMLTGFHCAVCHGVLRSSLVQIPAQGAA